MSKTDSERQAIVIIHGIGEQEPMQTLRGFAESVIPDVNPADDPMGVKEKFYVKPDELSRLFDLRRLTVPQDKKKTRIKTDFYEYYWAHQLRDTQLSDVLSWIAGIFLAGKYVPPRLKTLHRTLLLIVILVPVAVFALLYFFPAVKQHWAAFTAASAGMVYFIAKLIRHFINSISINFIGDAARYFTPKPGNIINRQQIRKEGLDLLKKLHDEHMGDKEKTPRYKRIVVVSHSLGSVIAYDLLALLWANYHSTLTHEDEKQQEKLKEMQDKVIAFSKLTVITDQELAAYKQLQAELLEASAAAGNPWRVTDFLTLGSPLAHAQLLMAKGKTALEKMQEERQYPTSPPALEAQQVISYRQSFVFDDGKKAELKVPHHGALFAFTHWTNVWFENDYVGGPMPPVFGKCITDKKLVSVTNPKIPFMSHTHYWDEKEAASVQIIKDIVFKPR
ncbi:MAG: hypothetical protein QM791_09705 [Ferruginibacter sp.]